MRNIKLTIEYDGTDYTGWQIQNKKIKNQKSKIKNRKTIQESLEKTLTKILQEKIKVIGSGRTDAGVHALGQVANFRTKSNLACTNIQRALNSILPEDIRIKNAEDVRSGFHARFSARSKRYRYNIVNDSFVSPHLRHFCYLVKHPLDLKKMRRASKYLLGRHNLRSFQAADKRERQAVRRILGLNIRKRNNLIYLDIEANGFLYRMARNIVGSLLEVGRGRISPEDIRRILMARNRIYAGPCAPAKGLCIMQVRYKELAGLKNT